MHPSAHDNKHTTHNTRAGSQILTMADDPTARLLSDALADRLTALIDPNRAALPS